jgi:hypothetical protein
MLPPLVSPFTTFHHFTSICPLVCFNFSIGSVLTYVLTSAMLCRAPALRCDPPLHSTFAFDRNDREPSRDTGRPRCSPKTRHANRCNPRRLKRIFSGINAVTRRHWVYMLPFVRAHSDPYVELGPLPLHFFSLPFFFPRPSQPMTDGEIACICSACMSACMYVCVCMYVFVCIHVCTHACEVA